MQIVKFTFLCLIILLGYFPTSTAHATDDEILPNTTVADLEKFIHDMKSESKIPGLAIVVVHNDKTLYQKGLGYANVSYEKKVEQDTLFELGSTSKAFTAQALFKLEEQGLVQLDDPITKYIPWLNFTYHGKPVQVTVEQLLHHTSGIPFKTIVHIPSSTSESALEETIRTLVGVELSTPPGEKFEYATINYDVLGYLIQKVSGVSFENYTKNEIFDEFSLNHTYFQGEVPTQNMATGYKVGFTFALAYNAPRYRGNHPAGYVVTNMDDVGRWMKIQLGSIPMEEAINKRIKRAHEPNEQVKPDIDGSSYAAGWQIYKNRNGEIAHSGNNPNFSSYIVFQPEEKLAVAVLANLNSEYTAQIGQGIMNRLQDKKEVENNSDSFIEADKIATAISIIFLIITWMMLFFIARTMVQIMNGRRKFIGFNVGKFYFLVGTILVICSMLSIALYFLPELFLGGLPWRFIYVWGPVSIVTAVILIGIAGCIFCLNIGLKKIFPMKNDKLISDPYAYGGPINDKSSQ
ncbi:beta-lactamase family protein [Hazenella sp. IB182357]|uniref:Beta-lactamase family protein n=1 Tax=Polycladospora coralii TaxID=2771432 RepID=A0A926RXN5_9BACL|nr:serine hydrolase domain-containing protein [Polycladospora coralii]MBD1372691.1 beta-lactamase family protein [Polycladospora coralii]MBS7531085.1 beta-lactamase family protein [Polycladospora coralii]